MHKATTRAPSLSIRHALPLLLVTLIVLTVGLTGWLAFRSGREAVDELATQLSGEVAARIEKHTLTHLDAAHLFHEINLAALRAGALDLEDAEAFKSYLWYQVDLTDAVPFIYLGTESGDFLGVQREADGSRLEWYLDAESMDEVEIYRLDPAGNRTHLVDSVPFAPQGRPWYEAAVTAGGPAWSPIYPDIARPILIITAVTPVYDESGALLGVLGIEFSLEQLSDFLHDLEISEGGEAFIVERTGEIVASSVKEPAFVTAGDDQERLRASESDDPLVRATALHLEERFGDLADIAEAQHLDLTIDGERHFVRLNPLQDGRGLDWLAVVVIPESDFMAPIYASARTTLLVGILILLIAIALGLVMAHWILRPILVLTDAAATVEAGGLEVRTLAPVARRTDELGRLARVFEQMVREVRARTERLKEEVRALRIEIDEVKRQRHVQQITESEYFRELREEARALRRRHEEHDADDS